MNKKEETQKDVLECLPAMRIADDQKSGTSEAFFFYSAMLIESWSARQILCQWECDKSMQGASLETAPGKAHTEQIVNVLRQVEVATANGKADSVGVQGNRIYGTDLLPLAQGRWPLKVDQAKRGDPFCCLFPSEVIAG